MKTTLIILSVFLIGCASPQNIIHEDTLYITRKYVGNFIELVPQKRITKIITTHEIFYITGQPTLDIKKGDQCYVKYFPERMAGSPTTHPILYFTWNGTMDMYMLRQNYITGEIIR